MRYSSYGLRAVFSYLLLAGLLLSAMIVVEGPKGAYVLGALATFPAGLLITGLGLVDFAIDHPWFNSFPVQTGISAGIIYAAGWLVEFIFEKPDRA